jgi:hypothetical protein
MGMVNALPQASLHSRVSAITAGREIDVMFQSYRARMIHAGTENVSMPRIHIAVNVIRGMKECTAVLGKSVQGEKYQKTAT